MNIQNVKKIILKKSSSCLLGDVTPCKLISNESKLYNLLVPDQRKIEFIKNREKDRKQKLFQKVINYDSYDIIMDIQKYQRINQSDDNKLKNNKIATYKNNKFRQFDIKKMKQFLLKQDEIEKHNKNKPNKYIEKYKNSLIGHIQDKTKERIQKYKEYTARRRMVELNPNYDYLKKRIVSAIIRKESTPVKLRKIKINKSFSNISNITDIASISNNFSNNSSILNNSKNTPNNKDLSFINYLNGGYTERPIINNHNNNLSAVDIDKIFQRKIEKIINSKEEENEKENNNEENNLKLNNTESTLINIKENPLNSSSKLTPVNINSNQNMERKVVTERKINKSNSVIFNRNYEEKMMRRNINETGITPSFGIYKPNYNYIKEYIPSISFAQQSLNKNNINYKKNELRKIMVKYCVNKEYELFKNLNKI